MNNIYTHINTENSQAIGLHASRCYQTPKHSLMPGLNCLWGIITRGLDGYPPLCGSFIAELNQTVKSTDLSFDGKLMAPPVFHNYKSVVKYPTT